jgi:hypothetical protein
MPEYVSLVKRHRLRDLYRYIIADAEHRVHTVEIPEYILGIEPREFQRGTDKDHLDIIACGTVLMRLDPESIFHKVDRSMVNRAYDAASRAQLLGRQTLDKVVSLTQKLL